MTKLALKLFFEGILFGANLFVFLQKCYCALAQQTGEEKRAHCKYLVLFCHSRNLSFVATRNLKKEEKKKKCVQLGKGSKKPLNL